ncbi:hypothetical protein ACFX12_035300 [Malus domestica]
MELSITNHGKNEPITNFKKDKVFAPKGGQDWKEARQGSFYRQHYPHQDLIRTRQDLLQEQNKGDKER